VSRGIRELRHPGNICHKIRMKKDLRRPCSSETLVPRYSFIAKQKHLSDEQCWIETT
jgi:hypothetical protein